MSFVPSHCRIQSRLSNAIKQGTVRVILPVWLPVSQESTKSLICEFGTQPVQVPNIKCKHGLSSRIPLWCPAVI
ncbi:hypothetical protein DPMN_078378 [Dreissena polymorpha]|uniref:Uncharacterized protein n=1 Tax=Dreissena polymorpha TaxID=45954 RepID=A0A9D3YQE7_DREPO|nr:hypothetical protein DPMN_078378 [Dreissena polymorpha]